MQAKVLALLITLVSILAFMGSHAQAGEAHFVWVAPETKVNGKPLTDLAGYTLYYWQDSWEFPASVDIGNRTTYTLTALNKGETYSFTITAYNTAGQESVTTDVIRHTIASNRHTIPANHISTDALPSGAFQPTDTHNKAQSRFSQPGAPGQRRDRAHDHDMPSPKGTDMTTREDAPNPDRVVFAVNAGGPAYVDSSGILYEADTHFEGGQTFTKQVAIGNTLDEALYQAIRFGDFSYAIPLPNGDYVITLQFAELSWRSADKRIFDVIIEGDEVLSNVDLVAEAGVRTAYDVAVPVQVRDEMLNLRFLSNRAHAKISAFVVEIVE